MTEQIQAELPAEAMRDDDDHIRPEFLARVVEAIEAGDAAFIRDLLTDLHEADIGDLIEALEADLRPRLIELAGDTFHFSALTEVDDSVRDELLEDLPPQTVAEGVRRTRIRRRGRAAGRSARGKSGRNSRQAAAARNATPSRAASNTRKTPAGRRMQTDFIAVPLDWTVGRTIDYLRESTELPDRFFEIYATSRTRKLRGTISLDRMMRPRGRSRSRTLVEEDRRRILATDDQEEVARLFEKYNLVAAPVADGDRSLVGVITADDGVDVIEEEAEEDLRQLQRCHQRRSSLSGYGWTVARGRFNRLLVNPATASIAAFVLGRFEIQIEQMVVLAILAPVVASQGGNAATQAMTVAVRALATRELTSRQCAPCRHA